MKVFKVFGVFLCFCFTAFTQAETFDVDKLLKVKWSKAESENFIVITDAKPAEAETYIRELENFRHFITVYLQQSIVEGLKPPTFLLIKNERLFKRLGLPENLAGVFIPTLSGPYSIAKSAGFRSGNMKPSFGAHVVRHELVHYLVENSISKFEPPLWYSEGLAEYLATYTDTKKRVTVGSLDFISFRFSSLKRHANLDYPDIEVESLFKARKRYQSENGAAREREMERFYGRSLATVHYLLSDNNLAKQLARYLRLIDLGANVDEAFSASFNRSYKELDEEIVNYLRGRKVYGRGFAKDNMKFPEVDAESRRLPTQIALLELLEVITKTSYDSWGKDETEEVVEVLDEVAKGNVRADILKLDAIENLNADEKLERVNGLLETHPSNKILLTIKGEILGSQARINFVGGSFDQELNLKARRSIRRALKQDPFLGRAYYALAETYRIEPYTNKNFNEAAVGYESAIFFRNDAEFYLKKADMLLAAGNPELAYVPLKRYFQLVDSPWEAGYGGFLFVVTHLASIKSWEVASTTENEMVFKDGSIYRGEIKNGWPEGEGTLTSASGFVYQGMWRNGRAHGEGSLKGPYALDFEGEFNNGNLTGQGELAVGAPENRLTYEGRFKNGYENGFGKFEIANKYTYEGQWFKGNFHGKGLLTLANGTQLKAQWGLDRIKISLDDGRTFFGYVNKDSGEINHRGICFDKKGSGEYCKRQE